MLFEHRCPVTVRERGINAKCTPKLLQSAHEKLKLTCSPVWPAAPAVCVPGQQTDRQGQIVQNATQHLLALLNQLQKRHRQITVGFILPLWACSSCLPLLLLLLDEAAVFVLVNVCLVISLHVCSVFITGRVGRRVGYDINPFYS